MIRDHEARVNITFDGQNFDLPDPVLYYPGGNIRAWEADIRQMAAEAIRTGSVPGVAARRHVDLSNFMVDRFDKPANPGVGQVDHNRVFVRPKTAYG
jgi:hypothetical protein